MPWLEAPIQVSTIDSDLKAMIPMVEVPTPLVAIEMTRQHDSPVRQRSESWPARGQTWWHPRALI